MLWRNLLTLLLTMIIVFALAACGKSGDDSLYPRTDALTLDLDYEGKSYIEDGIGEAILATCEDGDTAEFIVDGQQIRVRFLSIDTPEASHHYEPWGREATNFACSRLEDAETIVLERNFDGSHRDTYGRYLGFIWYDGRLLNLEIVEAGLADVRGALGVKYGTDIFDAWLDAQTEGKYIHGEDDPLFDYSDTIYDVTIEDIVRNYEDYEFSRVTVQGVITAKIGNHIFIEHEGYGIFVYTGHEDTESDLEGIMLNVGDFIEFEGAQVIYDLQRYGGVHLTDYSGNRITILETGQSITPHEITIDLINDQLIGRYVSLQNLTIIDIDIYPYTDQFILTVEDEEGNTLFIHQHRQVFNYHQLDPETLNIGDVINVEGPLRDSPAGIQLMLTRAEHLSTVE